MNLEKYEEIIEVIQNDKALVTFTVGKEECKSSEKALLLLGPHPSLCGKAENPIVTYLYNKALNHGYWGIKCGYRGVNLEEIYNESSISYWNRLDDNDDYKIIEDDIIASINRFCQEFDFNGEIYLIGYSFGAVIANRLKIEAKKILIAPPLLAHDFKSLGDGDLLISAELDSFSSPKSILEIRANGKVVEFANSDHFFIGKEEELVNLIFKEANL